MKITKNATDKSSITLSEALGAGTWIGLDDPMGLRHLRRIERVDGQVHALQKPLPWHPAAGCPVFVCQTITL